MLSSPVNHDKEVCGVTLGILLPASFWRSRSALRGTIERSFI